VQLATVASSRLAQQPPLEAQPCSGVSGGFGGVCMWCSRWLPTCRELEAVHRGTLAVCNVQCLLTVVHHKAMRDLHVSLRLTVTDVMVLPSYNEDFAEVSTCQQHVS
jgi:hypothetical protein